MLTTLSKVFFFVHKKIFQLAARSLIWRSFVAADWKEPGGWFYTHFWWFPTDFNQKNLNFVSDTNFRINMILICKFLFLKLLGRLKKEPFRSIGIRFMKKWLRFYSRFGSNLRFITFSCNFFSLWRTIRQRKIFSQKGLFVKIRVEWLLKGLIRKSWSQIILADVNQNWPNSIIIIRSHFKSSFCEN